MKLTADSAKAVAILAGTAAVLFLAVKLYQGSKAAAERVEKVVTEDLNPASDQNLAYKATNAVGAAVTGDKDFSLGVWIYEWIHGDETPTPPSVDHSIVLH